MGRGFGQRIEGKLMGKGQKKKKDEVLKKEDEVWKMKKDKIGR